MMRSCNIPGFAVNGNFGGHRNVVQPRQEYYSTYFWEIDNLFEMSFNNQPTLINLKECGLPTFTVNKEMVRGASLEYKYAKGIIWEDIKISWYDTKGFIDIIKGWRKSVWTPECGLQPANDYKRRSRLINYLPSNNEEGDVNWLLINSWPSIIRHGELTYAESNIKMVEVTVTYDWAEEKSE